MQSSNEQKETPKGMLVFVLRAPGLGDCTNGGISSKFEKFVIVGEGIPEIFEPNQDSPGLELVKRNINGNEYLSCKPLGEKDHTMFGGNYITSSDSRMPSKYPIPIHDRKETTEEARSYD